MSSRIDLTCKDCKGIITTNEYYHRAKLCWPCEDKRDKESIAKNLEFKKMLQEKDSFQLEDMWQGQCMIIKMALEKYYECGDEKYRNLAESAQKKQSKIQDEITRKAK